VALLRDEGRRALYICVRKARRPVTRGEAAAHVGISQKLAAFHLDKLVEVGLLQARYQAPEGRRVGRAPKVYEPGPARVRVDIPPREHEALAGILTAAVAGERPGETAWQAALRVARREGEQLGASEREAARTGRLGVERALTLADRVLEQHGYEPERVGPALLRLRNCPFQPLAGRVPSLVCGINQAYLAGILAGLGAGSTTAVLAPRPGQCCVELRPADPGTGTGQAPAGNG
jgi:predicted ArsR family transcriptional regulator